ncbi:MAG: sugar ABC transporter permease [Actinobacteria bacterium 13_1_20CM_2_65_11]|nr:MAG: sugar ABC transporter permease [Chloroflexi bacterium 13_1_40CM_65_17]OLC69004.1 MAG: sugar ABC transporter permease [Actinobacteria bacterium 13_1_40CM_4_65_12]OLD24903.1 MAG: sugar ABC transporter permease [Chloroflexi bacterium 13_1_40CM_3_65_12]OLD48904.1 MAG: sugar ABC transporter permease [Actinobacteria bacterium 13_1_40CM_2_65_8]OLE80802.1 MAG: sugar ABC transporter permease [Actinobacteria bacterium 13_1_20CM_2_65_11]
MSRRGAQRTLFDSVAVLILVVMLFPIYWMVSTALKPGKDILSLTPVWFPSNVTLDNFRTAMSQPFFWNDVVNSLTVVLSVVAISIALAFLAAVSVARFGFRGRTAFVVMVIAVQMVPLNALVIPVYLLLDSVGQVDSLLGVIAYYLAIVLPFMIWTLRGFVANVPVDLEEAAMVDGATRVSAFVRIVFPLVAPGLVATAIYGFIQAWNEYIIAYVLLSSNSKQTLTIWLASFTTQHGTDWGGLMAGATLTALPVVVFFLIVQRHVVGGLTAGAVKG